MPSQTATGKRRQCPRTAELRGSEPLKAPGMLSDIKSSEPSAPAAHTSVYSEVSFSGMVSLAWPLL